LTFHVLSKLPCRGWAEVGTVYQEKIAPCLPLCFCLDTSYWMLSKAGCWYLRWCLYSYWLV